MTDRELLEAAARAAGIEVMRSRLDDQLQRNMLVSNSARNPHHENGPWNPLTDDGDRWRLAESLGLTINFATGNVYGPQNSGVHVNTASTGKPLAWCVVRAAAAMGETA